MSHKNTTNPSPISTTDKGRVEVLQSYYSRIFRTYDLVNSLFTFGLDKKWRKTTVKECLALSPSKVLDLCCGTGDLAIFICESASRKINVVGYDLNNNMLDIARYKAKKVGVSPEFIQGNAASTPFKNEEFDCITIGFGFRNLTWDNPDRDSHIREMNRILKKEGIMLILESSQPGNPMLRRLYKLYLKYVLIPLGGILSGDWNAYRYLAGSSNAFYSFEQLKDLLDRYNFDLILKRKFLFGSANLLIARKFSS